MTLVIDEDQDPVAAGETLIYTLRYGNISESGVSSTTLTLELAGAVEFVSASGGGTFSGGEVSWNLGTLAAGQIGEQTVTVSVDASVPAGTLLEAAGLIDGTQDFLPTERSVGAVTSVGSSVPLSVALSLGANPSVAGSTGDENERLALSN